MSSIINIVIDNDEAFSLFKEAESIKEENLSHAYGILKGLVMHTLLTDKMRDEIRKADLESFEKLKGEIYENIG